MPEKQKKSRGPPLWALGRSGEWANREAPTRKDIEDYARSSKPLPKPEPDELSCPTCGAIIPKGAERCSYCGRKPGETPEEWTLGKNASWKCPTCGGPNPKGLEVCKYCGRKPDETPPEWARRTGARKEPPTVLPKVISASSEISKEINMPEDEKKRKREELNRIAGIVRSPIDTLREKRRIKEQRITERAEREEQIAKEYDDEEEKARRGEREATEAQAENSGGIAGRLEADREEELREMEQGARPLSDTKTRCSNPVCSMTPPHYGVYDINLTQCPYCRTPNRDLQLNFDEAICPFCKKIKKKKEEYCPHCKKRDPSYVRPKSLGEATGKKLNTTKIYEILIYEIAGVFVTFGLPFFGLPSLPVLGVVLMAIFPFYSFLPSERDAINSTEAGEEGLSVWAEGSLLLRGIVKMSAFILTVMQFMMIPVSKLIPLAISFVYYFTLPVSYKVTQPFKMIEAWFRIGVGALIAFFIFMAFNGTPQAITLAIMSVAFFCTSLPRHKEAPDERGVVRVEVLDKAGLRYLKGSLELPMKILFLFLMMLALVFSNVLPMLGGVGVPALISSGTSSSSLQIIFIAVWLLSLFSGWAVGSEGRPALGILMIGITLFVFTFTATGVMGQAVFGYWWPQVQSTGEAVFGPLGDVWSQAQNGMSSTWLLVTNPAAYYDQMNKQSQATTSTVTQGGTTKSIELTTTNLFTSVNGELEPRLDPLIGSFEIQNQGEFEANKIKLDLWATWTNPTAASTTNPPTPVPIGTLDATKFSCSQPFDLATSTSPIVPPTSPAGGGQIGTCNWTNTTYPSEIKVVNFVFEKNSWNIVPPESLADCINYDKSPLPCNDPSGNATYVHGGQTVKVNVNLTYDYNVNVSIPVEVINQDKYRGLLGAGQITLQQLTSQYTGGPVKATLWSQKQPVRSGELSLFVASIVNEGGGILNQIYNFKVLIPKGLADQGNIQIIAQTFESTINSYDGCGTIPTTGYLNPIDGSSVGLPNYWVIDCTNNVPMKSQEYKRVSFFITPKDVTDRKTSIIVGSANYEYIKTGSTTITVANAPWH